MTDQKRPKKQGKSSETREDRLKAALKANLARRKAQARVRTGAEQEQSPKGTE